MIQASELARGPKNALRVEVLDDPRAWTALRPEWDALLEASDASLFNAWEWLEPWHRRLGKDRRLHLLTARDGQGLLVGLMPLCLQRIDAGARKIRRLGFLGEAHVGSDYLDLIAVRGQHPLIAERFAGHLLETHAGWDLLELNEVEASSPTLDVFRRVFAVDPFRLRFSHRGASPSASLQPGERFEDFLRRTGRRQRYLQQRRWLQAQPGFAIERAEKAPALTAAFEELLRLRGLRRKPTLSRRSGPSLEAFHRHALVRLAERGRVRLYTLKVGGEAVASVYGLVHRHTFFYYLSAVDPRWRERGAGLVLIGETFADALASGLRSFEFLRSAGPAFAGWTARRSFTLGLRIWPSDGAGAWLTRREDRAREVRERLRALLPQALRQPGRALDAWRVR